MKTITIELRQDDAEPILREAAYEAARCGSMWLYLTARTVDMPNAPMTTATFDKRSGEWQARAQRAERIVEAFGIEVDRPSEGETLTTYVPDIVLKSHTVQMAGLAFRHIDKSKPDPSRKNWRPQYRRSVHEEACHQAADRVVRRWRGLAVPALTVAEAVRSLPTE